MMTRQSYQNKRRSLLASRNDLGLVEGLEIGACDLPTVTPDQGRCLHADFRSADDMSGLWNIPRDQICDVDFVIDRNFSLSEQISSEFDYVVACHVIEHVPDPISYIRDLAGLVRPGGSVMLTVPDKRQTPDRTRPSTSLDHLVGEYHDKCRYPSIEHIMEFHRHWMSDQLGYDFPLEEAFTYACAFHASGEADVHCHVWTDAEFHDQIARLIKAEMLPGLSIALFEATQEGFNEFTIILQKAG